MIEIYVRNIRSLYDKTAFDTELLKVDSKRREKINACKKQPEKVRSLGAGLLLMQGLERYLKKEGKTKNSGELEYCYGENGKPSFKEYPDFQFNLSHSGDYVVGVFSDEKVGIDIQEMRTKERTIARRFFTRAEQVQIEQAGLFQETNTPTTNVSTVQIPTTQIPRTQIPTSRIPAVPHDREAEKTDAFYCIWAAKESYMKYTGLGMRLPLDSFNADIKKQVINIPETGETAAYLFHVNISGDYKCMVCTGQPISDDSRVIYQCLPV